MTSSKSKTLAEQAEHTAEDTPMFTLDEQQPYESNRAERHAERAERLAKEQAEREELEAELAEQAAQRVQDRKAAREATPA